MSIHFFLVPGWASSPIVYDSLIPLLEKYGNVTCFSWLDALGDEPALHTKIKQTKKPICLIGWSLGAAAVLRAAIAFPDKVTGLVTFAATPKLPHTEDLPGADPRACRAMQVRLYSDPQKLLEEFALNSCYPMCNERLNQAFVKNAMLQDRDILVKGLVYLNQSDWRLGTETIAAKTLIFHGTQDRIVPVAAASWLKQRIPNAEFVEITDGGHMILFTHTAQIIDRVHNFLEKYFTLSEHDDSD